MTLGAPVRVNQSSRSGRYDCVEIARRKLERAALENIELLLSISKARQQDCQGN